MIEQHYGELTYLQFSHLQQFPELIHGVFTRLGGYSPAPYQGLNMATPAPQSVDTIENVVQNRQLALSALGLPDAPALTIWQVHGADVALYRSSDPWRTDWSRLSYYQHPWTPLEKRKGDAIITHERGTVLTLAFADCVPLVFYDPLHQVIGIAHGGWRGTARAIALTTVEALQYHFGSRPEDLYVGIGPSIGPCCYEVSREVQALFEGTKQFEQEPTAEAYSGIVRECAVFSEKIIDETVSLRLDLQATHRKQLHMAGVPDDRIETMTICTSCNTERFCSHRREQGQTGRFAVMMALANT